MIVIITISEQRHLKSVTSKEKEKKTDRAISGTGIVEMMKNTFDLFAKLF